MTLSICQTAPRSRSPGILLEFDGIHRPLVWISRVSTIALSRAKRTTHSGREDDEKLSRHSSDALGFASRGAAAAGSSVSERASIFRNGANQAVRLPQELRHTRSGCAVIRSTNEMWSRIRPALL